MAREAGVEAFCYWHYWFGGGKMLLQRPFEEVLKSGKPDFPFCLAWANHDWTNATWKNGGTKEMIAKQTYPGDEDYKAHFEYVLPAFRDHRYVTVDGKPIFVIYDPYHFADVPHFIQYWRRLAEENGLPGIHFVALINSTTTIRRDMEGRLTRVMPNIKSSQQVYEDILSLGFDAINSNGKSRAEMCYEGTTRRIAEKLLRRFSSHMPAKKWDYAKVMPFFFSPEDSWENVYPMVMPQWDRSPRIGNADGIYVNSTPENFHKHLQHALNVVKDKKPEHRILFLHSWNEWAEGNYVEPDLRYGHGYLDAISDVINK